MLRLYRRVNGLLHYHEAWGNGEKITEHWGQVGERGETKERDCHPDLSEEDNLAAVLAAPFQEGFSLLDEEEWGVLLIEYAVDGMGTEADLEKRHALEDRMNETLGWTGLGYCDGGSIGSGTMEVCCFVVDFEVASRVIADDLAGTEFGDYSRIFEE